MTKISDLSALTGASVDAANNLVTVVDMSEAGAARNKKMTFAELKVSIGAYTPGGTDVAVSDGGTGASTAAGARTNLGATTVGANIFTLTNPSAITFLRMNADNTVDALSAAAFRTAIGAGTGSGSGDLLSTNNLSDVASATTSRTNLAAAAASQPGEQISGFIASPSNKSYTIALDMKHAGTITEVTTKSASGTCTATWKINSTALGGTANSVSSSEQTQSHASSNVFAAGDDIVLTVSSNSSCADMSFTIKYTRTLA